MAGFLRFLGRMFNSPTGSKPPVSTDENLRFMMVGLDAAGKTTILYKLGLGSVETHIPTTGFHVMTLEYNNMSFVAWTLGGADKCTPLLRHYCRNASALIFVVDSNDRDRMSEASGALASFLRDCGEVLRGCPLLVLANKQDLPNAMPTALIAEALSLDHVPGNRAWQVQPCCATMGEGLSEGLGRLQACLIARNKNAQVGDEILARFEFCPVPQSHNGLRQGNP
jgi:small GTP-binding protein